MILTGRTKLLDSKLIKASFGERFFSLSRKSDILQETVKNQRYKNQVDNTHKQKMQHTLWQKLFSLSLKPKEPISGNRFGVTPPWWGLFSWNWKPIQLFIENFRKKWKWNYYLVKMFYRICWKLQNIYLHIRVTNISLINTLKENKRQTFKKTKSCLLEVKGNQN